MRARKEERNQRMLEDKHAGVPLIEIAGKYNLSYSRTTMVLRNQERWNRERREKGCPNP